MDHFKAPPSSQPPPQGQFGLRLSVPSSISHNMTPLSPISFLLRAALIFPNKTAIIHPEKGIRFTYAEWAARCLSLTFAIKSTPNWKKGDRVAIIAPNTPMSLEAYYGILAAGGVATPLNIRNNEREIAYVLEHSGASVILVDEEFVQLVPKQLPSNITLIVSKDTGGGNGIESDQYEAFLHKGRQEWQKAEKQEVDRWGEKAKKGWELIEVTKDENDPCCLCYTSGTTGRPKGVLTTHRGSYLAACSNAFEFRLTSESVYLWVLPAFHAAGWTFPWAVTAALGTHCTIRKVDNDLIWDALRNYGVSHYCAAPTVNIGLVNHAKAKKLPHSVLCAVAASAPTAELLQSMESLNLIPVHYYGQTENYGPFVKRYMEPSWSNLSVQERAQLIARQGHGYLASDEVRVIKIGKENDSDTNGDERDLIDVRRDGQEIGEIIMRGNLAMLEYYNDKEATSKTIKHGWLHTGDLAVRHQGGEIHIRDRQKDIIISGGENISSLAVEDEIASHEAVLECCVVARPHEKWGEVGHAFVILKRGRTLTAEDLRQYCRTRMSKFAVPAYIEFVDALPKTSTGKVQKNVLREKLRKAKL